MKTIDKIWIQRKQTFDKLLFDVKWLINNNMPKNQKHAIWNKKWDEFVLTSLNQDKKIRKLIPE